MQFHKRRCETWLFIFGSGVLEYGNFLHDLCKENIKSGDFRILHEENWHQYTAKTPTLVLEIQTGKCSERDIVRV